MMQEGRATHGRENAQCFLYGCGVVWCGALLLAAIGLLSPFPTTVYPSQLISTHARAHAPVAATPAYSGAPRASRLSSSTPSASPAASLRVLLCGNARDEASVLEWLVHHKLLGFSHALLFDHLSLEPLAPLVRDAGLASFVTVVRREDGNGGLKSKLMTIAHAYSVFYSFDWVLYLDVDEFLALPRHSTVQDFLAEYNEFDQVGVNWMMFGTSNHSQRPPGGLLASYTRSDESLNQHVKSFLHVAHDNAKAVLFMHPHFYHLKSLALSVGIDKRPLTDPFWAHHPNGSVLHSDVVAYVAHYLFQSFDVYLQRKVQRPRDDTGEMRDVMAEAELHAQHNAVENMYMANHYGPRVAAFLATSVGSHAEEEDPAQLYFFQTLPSGWTLHVSTHTGRVYFFHALSGNSTYEPPQ